MRIACVHVPQFALQCVTRIDPSLRGAPVAVVGSGLDTAAGAVSRVALHSPVVQACSRAAYALGVRIGMTATAARGASPDVHVVTADAALERDTVRALADALLGASAVVDIGGRVGAGSAHLAMYCEVPSKTRGGSFGERLVERIGAMGISCRIGIADDRFTAWVAASAPPPPSEKGDKGEGRVEDIGVVTVPRGGSAAFLAPRPLSILAISPEVQHMLEALGVCTLGEFAALPAPSVARPIEADYRALARGESGNVLRPYAPDMPVREHAAIRPEDVRSARGAASGGALSGPAAVAMLAQRLAVRLAGRGRGAARLEVTVGGEAGERTISVALAQAGRVLETAEDLAEAIGGAIGDLGAAWRIRVAVVGETLAAVAAGVAAGGATAAGASAPAIGETVAPDGNPVPSAGNAGADEAEREALDLALSEGAPAWTLSPVLGGDRRDGYRRTRHGKRRARSRSGEALDALLQPKLFKNNKP
jgi:hypothetical protein